MPEQFFVYILTTKKNTTLYIGVTNDLKKRVFQHKEKLAKSFTRRYNVDRLVYYEIYDDPESAIAREKQLKAGPRQRKIDLINGMNKDWNDLYIAL